ncbi:MAG TPA: hypothetical protein VJM15_07915 [Sphingomicrobium sp.]|nr:hypothetical protein [Sphingomicrobium sp.]
MLVLAAALIAASPPVAPIANCPMTTRHHAWQRDQQVRPRKLTELPPAQGYMAVYRTVAGCEVPMTVIEYRRGTRR